MLAHNIWKVVEILTKWNRSNKHKQKRKYKKQVFWITALCRRLGANETVSSLPVPLLKPRIKMVGCDPHTVNWSLQELDGICIGLGLTWLKVLLCFKEGASDLSYCKSNWNENYEMKLTMQPSASFNFS